MRQLRYRIFHHRYRTKWLLLLNSLLAIWLWLGWINFAPSTANTGLKEVQYQTIERSHSTIHTVTIPFDSNYVVSPRISGELKPITDFREFNQDAIIAGINGGYFDPVNQKTTSFVVQDDRIVADPRFNERLVDNPDLKVYLGKIFNRGEFRYYDCQGQKQYDIQPHSAPIPNNCTLKASLAAGPQLLPRDTSEPEAFIAYDENGTIIRDAIGSQSLNARSGIGITATGDIILAMAAQQPQQPTNSGVTLSELAEVLTNLGAVKAMNLDGGSSASMFYGDRVIYGRVDNTGQKIQRPIKSVLLVQKTAQS